MEHQAATPAPPTRPPREFSRLDRTGSALCALACLALLVLAAWMRPSDDGHGTHTQMGLSACQWVQAFGQPCMTCGMTTAFAHAADGRYAQAAVAQPMGLLLALGTSVVFWGGLHSALGGVRVAHVALGGVNVRSLMVVAGLGLAAWVYKLATWGG